MEKKKVVVALGHRALATTLPEQKKATKEAAKAIADLVESGAQIVISHSNAPQVGMIHTAMNEFGKVHPDYTVAPISVCSAMSQGYIGYDIQNAIRAELLTRGIFKSVCTVLTQVKVDPYDEAFYEPTKVIGRCLTKDEADLEEQKGNYVIEEENGYRRILASPKPLEIVELDSIRALLDAGQIVVACGGGGIPVLEQGVELHGASAVIEKDLVSGKLACDLQADVLMILTSVEKVALNYHSSNESLLGAITLQEAKQYIAEEQFETTTMLPKFEAAVSFLEAGSGRKAIITSISKAKDAFLGKTGTIIQ